MRILRPESMSRRVSPLAGFQVTIIGRIWVTTEVSSCCRMPLFNVILDRIKEQSKLP